MSAERGQASVEWAAAVLLVALALGALGALAPRVDGRPLGELIAGRIGDGAEAGRAAGRSARDAAAARSAAQPAATRPSAARRSAHEAAPLRAGAMPPPALPRGRRLRELLRKGARRGIAANGLACYLRKSTERGDPDRVGDDVADAVNCLNPVDGWTGELRDPGHGRDAGG